MYLIRLWCTFTNVHSPTSMVWNKMSRMWRCTDEAQVTSNTYSCKTGSLCDSGRPPAENSTHSARAHTPGSQWEAIGQQGVRETQWDEQKQMTRKQQEVTVDQCWLSQKEQKWLRLQSYGSHHRCKNEWQWQNQSGLNLCNQTHIMASQHSL